MVDHVVIRGQDSVGWGRRRATDETGWAGAQKFKAQVLSDLGRNIRLRLATARQVGTGLNNEGAKKQNFGKIIDGKMMGG
jgi:hypothetical protein